MVAKNDNARRSMEQEAMHRHDLISSPIAQFPGSFAPDSREAVSKPVLRHGEISRYFSDGWTDAGLWRSAFIESIGSMSLCYLSGLIDITIGSLGTKQVAPYVGITNVFLLSLLIYSLSPASGGHINPLISFTTMAVGLTGFSRGIMYIIGQTLGAAVAGGLIRASLGKELTLQYGGGGCHLTSASVIPPRGVFTIEVFLSFILTMLAFGVGLDPRQRKLFGPTMGPILVGCTLGLVTFSSVGVAPGYPGAGLNPARCFAFAVARGEFEYQWIWWIGPLVGGLLHTAVYLIAPPYHLQRSQEMVLVQN